MSKRFQKIHIEISNVCNLQCSFCPEVLRPKSWMSVEHFKKVVLEASPLAESICLHLMGEPLAHPQFLEMTRFCEEQNVSLHIVTNGILLSTEKKQALLTENIRQVNFSIHSFFDNYPNKSPDAYLQRILSFADEALQKAPWLYINYRLWNLENPNKEKATNLSMLKKISEHYSVTPPKVEDVRRRKSFRLKHRHYFHFDTEFVWPSLELPFRTTQGTCHALSTHIGILADGTVVPCCLDKESQIPLGNAFREPLEKILESQRAVQMKKGFQKGQLVEELCQKCLYIQRFDKKSKSLLLRA